MRRKSCAGRSIFLLRMAARSLPCRVPSLNRRTGGFDFHHRTSGASSPSPSSMADSGLSRSILIIRWPSVPACSPQRQRYPYQTHSCRWHQRPGGKRYIRHTKHSPQQKIAQAASHGQKNADSTEIGYTDAIK